jgi:hypothetical protein
MSRIFRGFLFVLASLLFLSGIAAAQAVGTASIQGRLTDDTGATLPGVTVTITSPALQLPQMVFVSETDGQYRFIDIPIGIYSVRYELEGFQSLVREGIRLTAGFVARLDIVLKVGSLSETMTVSGQSPVVDTSTTAGIVNFTKEMLQSVPNTRSMWQVLAMSPGVRPAGTPDVGGSQLGIQQGYKNYGTTGQVTPQLEGINTRQADSSAGFFYDYNALEEAQVKSVGNDAEVALPGTNWIAIVKSGGNDFHGGLLFSGEHSSMQSDNLDDRLRANGVRSGNPLRYLTDFGADLGGRLIRDRLWFYGALRDQRRQNEVIGYVKDAGPDGKYQTADDTPGYQDLILTNQSIKGTYQASKNQKIIGFFQRNLKDEPQSTAGRFVPFEATYNYDFPTQATKAEWQATPRQRLLFDVLAGRQWYDANRYPQDGTNVKGNPRRQDRETTFVTGPNPTQLRPRSRWQTTGSLSYFPNAFLGGSHSFKAGYQIYLESVGTAWPTMAAGDYMLIYDRDPVTRAQVPAEIEAYNNPVLSPVNKETQYSIFLQDKWAVGNRLTFNLGLRWDRYHAFVDEQVKEQGVFGTAGTFPAVDVLTWKSAAPRAAAAWDVTGDGKTVAKATYGYFTHVMTEDFAQNYNQNARTIYRYRWRDTNGNNDYDPGEVNLALNGTDFISVTGASNNLLNPDLEQPVTHEVSLSIERELASQFSAKALYVYKRQNNGYEATNVLRPVSAWSIPITRIDPGPDGVTGTADDRGPVTLYDYPAAFRGAAFVGNKFLNAPDDRDDNYDTIELTVNKRMTRRWDMLTSYSLTKNHRWIRATPQSPNDEFFPLDETYDWQFKLVGSYQLPGGISTSAFFQHLAGDPLQRTYIFRSIPNATTVTLRLEPLGERREPNLNVLNLRGSKKFAFGNRKLQFDVDVFNLTNTNSATTINQASGASFGAISVIVPPRIARAGVTFTF